ncbi:MAG: hypothetical protein EKK53_18890 [Burkholderiales bacterium]|nr:MAG: hypothetical protein EKK53_18890 [Burkholderiales bacterium]
MNRLLPALLCLALAACADTPAQQDVNLAMPSDMVCQTETPTGSNMPKKRCRTEAQRRAEQDQVKDFEQNRRTSPGDPMGR